MENWVLVADHDDGETYVNANSISRSAVSTRAEFKRVYSPPIADKFSGNLITSLRSKEEHDLVNIKCRVHARCHQYADGSERNLGGDGYWTFVEGESEARLRFVQIFGSGPVVSPDLPGEIGAATITEDRKKELRKRYGPVQASAQAAYDRPRMLVKERINFSRKRLGLAAKKVTIRAIQAALIFLFIYGHYSLRSEDNYYSRKDKVAGTFIPPYTLYIGGKRLYQKATSPGDYAEIKSACLSIAREQGVVKVSRNWVYVCECVAAGGDFPSCNSEYLTK